MSRPSNIRNLIIEREPFKKFHLECGECGEELFTVADYRVDQHLAMKVLIEIRLEKHIRETGHTSVIGDVHPTLHLNNVEIDITVNDVRDSNN